MRVKVCGLTRRDDVVRAVDLGVDALGFNFVPGSPRRLTAEDAARLADGVPPFVTRVGVFADTAPDQVAATARAAGLDVAQMHGHESPEACAAIPIPWFKALRVDDRFDPREAARYGRPLVLLDADVPGRLGGTGLRFDWDVARRTAAWARVIVAGGLDAEVVGDAIARARPFAVDVNSGVETSPGLKDAGRLALFCRRVREASARWEEEEP